MGLKALAVNAIDQAMEIHQHVPVRVQRDHDLLIGEFYHQVPFPET